MGNAHQQHIQQLGAPLRLAAFFYPVAGEQQKARHDQSPRHEIDIAGQALHQILHRQHQKQRQRAHDNQQDHPPCRRDGVGCGAANQIADAVDQLHDHVPDILPVGREHCHQGSQVQQHVKKVRRRRNARLAQEVLRNGQMAGTGDGQELRQALDQAQQDG